MHNQRPSFLPFAFSVILHGLLGLGVYFLWKHESKRLNEDAKSKKSEILSFKLEKIQEPQIVSIPAPEKQEAPDQTQKIGEFDSRTTQKETVALEPIAKKRLRTPIQKPTLTPARQASGFPGVVSSPPSNPLASKPPEKANPNLSTVQDKNQKQHSIPTRKPDQNRTATNVPNVDPHTTAVIRTPKQDLNRLLGSATQVDPTGHLGLQSSDLIREIEKEANRTPGLENFGMNPRYLIGAGGAIQDYQVGETTYLNVSKRQDAAFFSKLIRALSNRWSPREVIFSYLRTNKRQPTKMEVVIGIDVDVSGQLKRAFVIRSSKIPGFDEEALQTVRDSAPFSKPSQKDLKDGDGKTAYLAIPFIAFIHYRSE